jgi:hypothetical protein
MKNMRPELMSDAAVKSEFETLCGLRFKSADNEVRMAELKTFMFHRFDASYFARFDSK